MAVFYKPHLEKILHDKGHILAVLVLIKFEGIIPFHLNITAYTTKNTMNKGCDEITCSKLFLIKAVLKQQ